MPQHEFSCFGVRQQHTTFPFHCTHFWIVVSGLTQQRRWQAFPKLSSQSWHKYAGNRFSPFSAANVCIDNIIFTSFYSTRVFSTSQVNILSMKTRRIPENLRPNQISLPLVTTTSVVTFCPICMKCWNKRYINNLKA